MQRNHTGNGDHISPYEDRLSEFDRALADVAFTGPKKQEPSAFFRLATEGQRASAGKDAVVPDDLSFNETGTAFEAWNKDFAD